jgi:carbonic anhydrase
MTNFKCLILLLITLIVIKNLKTHSFIDSETYLKTKIKSNANFLIKSKSNLESRMNDKSNFFLDNLGVRNTTKKLLKESILKSKIDVEKEKTTSKLNLKTNKKELKKDISFSFHLNDLNMIQNSDKFKKPYLKIGKAIFKNWFYILSSSFSNNKKFPTIHSEYGEFLIKYQKKNFKRINPLYKKGLLIPNKYSFYFRLSKYYIWYSFNRINLNIIGRISIENIFDLKFLNRNKEYCFNIIEKSKDSWIICKEDKLIVINWFCKIIKFARFSKDKYDRCDYKKYKGKIKNEKVLIKTITQPFIIIPTATHTCNQGWTYERKGNDWECLCKEGLEQSPIDLPPIDKAIESDTKPIFEYDKVDPIMSTDYEPTKLNSGDYNVIIFENEALRIKHPNFGKIITLDGTVYIAQEIVFHTPSEHTIDGVKFDMEMQIIHYGKSTGDSLKSIILSFLFKEKPGAFNKFFEKLEYFNLPNPKNKSRKLSQTLFIPEILQENGDFEDFNFIKPFNFYSYQGSHTAPPCDEKTIHYVASNPIELSSTTLKMFKESLRIPDQIDSKGNINDSNKSTLFENNRSTQALNGRAIFHHYYLNCNFFGKIKQGGDIKKGHYEKIIKTAVEYIHVNRDIPSGIPNSFVVTNKEAEALEENYLSFEDKKKDSDSKIPKSSHLNRGKYLLNMIDNTDPSTNENYKINSIFMNSLKNKIPNHQNEKNNNKNK